MTKKEREEREWENNLKLEVTTTNGKGEVFLTKCDKLGNHYLFNPGGKRVSQSANPIDFDVIIDNKE